MLNKNRVKNKIIILGLAGAIAVTGTLISAFAFGSAQKGVNNLSDKYGYNLANQKYKNTQTEIIKKDYLNSYNNISLDEYKKQIKNINNLDFNNFMQSNLNQEDYSNFKEYQQTKHDAKIAGVANFAVAAACAGGIALLASKARDKNNNARRLNDIDEEIMEYGFYYEK